MSEPPIRLFLECALDHVGFRGTLRRRYVRVRVYAQPSCTDRRQERHERGGGGGNKYRERLPELLQGCVASLHHSIADPCVVLQQRLLVTSLREPLRACFRIGPDGGHDPLQAGDALLQQLQARGLLVVPKQTFLGLLLGVEPGYTLFIDL